MDSPRRRRLGLLCIIPDFSSCPRYPVWRNRYGPVDQVIVTCPARAVAAQSTMSSRDLLVPGHSQPNPEIDAAHRLQLEGPVRQALSPLGRKTDAEPGRDQRYQGISVVAAVSLSWRYTRSSVGIRHSRQARKIWTHSARTRRNFALLVICSRDGYRRRQDR